MMRDCLIHSAAVPMDTHNQTITSGADVRLYVNREIRHIAYLAENHEESWYFLLSLSGGYACFHSGEREVYGCGLMILNDAGRLKDISFHDTFEGFMLKVPLSLIMDLDIATDMHFNTYILEHPFVTPSPEQTDRLCNYLILIRQALDSRAAGYYESEVTYLCKAFIKTCQSYYDSQEMTVRSNRRRELANTFLKLLKENHSTERKLQFYADRMGISIKYLSYVVSTATGKKAQKWLEEYTLMDARKMLRQTNRPINEIATSLGFLSSSDFCKYFKKGTGMSPKDFRLM